MPLAAVSAFEFVAIGVGVSVLLLLLLVGRPATGLSFADRMRLRRIEDKLDLVMNSLGLKYETSSAAMWQEAADAGDKIGAIRDYREQTRVGLKEAKEAVDAYLEKRGR